MRIAIDYTSAVVQRGGIGRYTRELVAALAAQDTETNYFLFVAGRRESDLPSPPGINFSWKTAASSDEWLARLWYRARLPIPIERWTGLIDLLHAPDFVLPPTGPNTRTLLTVHDLSFVRSPETTPPRLRVYLEKVVPRSVKRSDRVLADSETTRQDLIRLYGTPPQKVTVLYCGVGDQFYPIDDKVALRTVRDRYGIGNMPYILSVGAIHPRKNYPSLLEAFHRMNRPALKLVIAGGKGDPEDPVYRHVVKLGIEEQVIFTGYVADRELPALYAGARVFAFPSIYEGFGLPALEAMACGVPVVASNAASIPEVVGDAGLQVDPLDVDALTDALTRALDDDDLRNQLINKGQLRAQSFSWRTAARQLRAIYAELV